MKEKQCSYIKNKGEQCRAKPVKGTSYCFSHNPDMTIEKHLAVIKGGLNSRKVNINLAPLIITDPKEVTTLLEQTINGVRSGEIPTNIANTIGYLAGHVLKSMELSKYADKIESVERVLMERKIIK